MVSPLHSLGQRRPLLGRTYVHVQYLGAALRRRSREIDAERTGP